MLIGKSSINGPFSMAMLVHQRVILGTTKGAPFGQIIAPQLLRHVSLAIPLIAGDNLLVFARTSHLLLLLLDFHPKNHSLIRVIPTMILFVSSRKSKEHTVPPTWNQLIFQWTSPQCPCCGENPQFSQVKLPRYRTTSKAT